MFQGNIQNYEKVGKQELRNESEVPKRELGNRAFLEQLFNHVAGPETWHRNL
jgi:hypothetical protein